MPANNDKGPAAKKWGKAVRLFIQESGLMMTDIAKQIKVSSSLVNFWCSGKANINKNHYEKLCKILPKVRDIEPPVPFILSAGEQTKLPKRITTKPDSARKLRKKLTKREPRAVPHVQVEPFNLRRQFFNTALQLGLDESEKIIQDMRKSQTDTPTVLEMAHAVLAQRA